jgi:hypothetical protein
MTKSIWVVLTKRESTVLLDALSSLRSAGRTDHSEFDALASKLARGMPYPQITVGVHGGLVQWTRGNPFPIRICDYDGFDLPDVDERGERCETWLEPADRRSKRSGPSIKPSGVRSR